MGSELIRYFQSIGSLEQLYHVRRAGTTRPSARRSPTPPPRRSTWRRSCAPSATRCGWTSCACWPTTGRARAARCRSPMGLPVSTVLLPPAPAARGRRDAHARRGDAALHLAAPRRPRGSLPRPGRGADALGRVDRRVDADRAAGLGHRHAVVAVAHRVAVVDLDDRDRRQRRRPGARPATRAPSGCGRGPSGRKQRSNIAARLGSSVPLMASMGISRTPWRAARTGPRQPRLAVDAQPPAVAPARGAGAGPARHGAGRAPRA